MRIVRSRAGLAGLVAGWRKARETVGVVPTMGALHEGHLSLVRAARAGTDRVIVTIFVNPAQFDNAADLAAYPRTEAPDAALLRPLAPDLVFAPPTDEVYPPGFATRISVGGLAERLEGAQRPGHFDGVATVVAKLFGMTQADRAYFGEKDWQQLQVVRQLVRDLNMPVGIVGCPTIREADGLARSSRNMRLSPEARTVAAALPGVLAAAARSIGAGREVEDALRTARAALTAAGFERVEYFDLCDPDTLLPLDRPVPGARLLAAAWVGGVRLIDNMAVG
ncbi:MAG: pantoate--beta-alanine ligase [Pseudomonadota bacterium]